VADIVQRLIEAMVAVADADLTLRQVMGRVDGLLTPWQTPEVATSPALVYAHIATTPVAGAGDARTSLIQLTVWAEGQGAQGMCHAILERCETLFAPSALRAVNGIDAAPVALFRRGATFTDPEGSRGLVRADLDIDFLVTA
jgi:hypothetical protein